MSPLLKLKLNTKGKYKTTMRYVEEVLIPEVGIVFLMRKLGVGWGEAELLYNSNPVVPEVILSDL